MHSRALVLTLMLACLGSACSEDPPLLPTEAQTPPFSWSLYLDQDGKKLAPGRDRWLVRRSEHLEHVYALAALGQEPAKAIFANLEAQFAGAGQHVAMQVTSLRCAAVDLAGCYPQWGFLDELLGPSRGPGVLRLRQALTDAFDATARERRMENNLRLSVLNVLMAGGMVKAAVGKASLAEARAVASAEQRALAEGASAEARGLASGEGPAAAVGARQLAGVSGRLVITPEVSAMQARLVEAELLETGPRHTLVVKDLSRMRPSMEHPPQGVAGDNALWRDYVSYWERRFAELTTAEKGATVRPPLTWTSYRVFRSRFAAAMRFQSEVSAELQRDVGLPRQQRRWLGRMEKPRVDDNVGLSHEGSPSRTYADHLAIDESTLERGTPRVETFSTKQRDLSRMGQEELETQVALDAKEALAKYGGSVQVRRPGHPLFERRVPISRVHLVYDEALAPQVAELRKAMATAATQVGVELHFHHAP